MSRPTAYLDTCIVSGLAKNELGSEAPALLRILEAREVGRVGLVASVVLKQELDRIPAAHRASHEAIYHLLANVPTAPTHVTRSRVVPSQVVSAYWHENPLYAQLRRLLPDAPDAEHTFQAASANVPFLITVDRRSFLRHARAVEALCGVRLLTPAGFESAVLINS